MFLPLSGLAQHLQIAEALAAGRITEAQAAEHGVFVEHTPPAAGASVQGVSPVILLALLAGLWVILRRKP